MCWTFRPALLMAAMLFSGFCFLGCRQPTESEAKIAQITDSPDSVIIEPQIPVSPLLEVRMPVSEKSDAEALTTENPTDDVGSESSTAKTATRDSSLTLVSDPQADSTTNSSEVDNGGKNTTTTKLQLDDAFKWRTWPEPEAVIVITGQQHGYIEPCGCTGLENQKGGLARRHTLFKQLEEKGWNLVPVDSGNQVRRFGPQPTIKFETAVKSLDTMHYKVVGLGPDDLRLGVENLLSVAVNTQEMQFISANIVLFDPSMLKSVRIIESGKRKIAVTTAIDPAVAGKNISSEITINDPVEELTKVAKQLTNAVCDYRVLLWYGNEVSAAALLMKVPNWDLVVLGNDDGEPTFQPETLPGSTAKIVRVGHKAMNAVLIGLYDDKSKFQYARVPLTHEFDDSPEMMTQFASYQKHLEALGLEGLGLRPIPHPTSRKFVGSEACGDCHTTAYKIWQQTPHAKATDSLVHPPNNRANVPRHFDPECLSCHSTGWNAQDFYPYETGYLSLTKTPKLIGNGCENCHGPGAAHAAAETGDIEADDTKLASLRESMQLPLAKARDTCMECHDIDNSPDFHKDGAFEKYWSKIEHKGLD